MRPGAGLCFLVQLHLDPNRESALTEILARDCQLTVVTARNGDSLQADHVYVIPPAVVATVANSRIVLQPLLEGKREPRAIDVLFSSLALDLKERAIGVVLSGSGMDGTIGIKAIKEAGGLSVAQGGDGAGPGHASMPDSAIASGLVDLILPAGEIPAKLAEYVGSFGSLAALTAKGEDRAHAEQERVDAARQDICDILRREVGHDFSGYKEATFLRRVQRRMQVLQTSTLEEYIGRLRSQHDEAKALLRDLLISVTAFFRDTDAFATLSEQVIPQLFAGRGSDDTVRIWVPGCATGEEAYSIAMLLREYAADRNGMPRLQVFASDIDDSALDVEVSA
jgi:two-component system CheB/CheR fusion protein